VPDAVQDQKTDFALDIGTRSIVGVLGREEGGRFHVLAIEKEEHGRRAMLDGQIEDIDQVAKVAREVTDRLEQRLGQLDLQKKNWKAGAALLSLRGQLDMDETAHLSGYDRERVCVPRICDCGREGCRYRAFLEDCDSGRYLFQICNHNLLLADAIHRRTGLKPILPFPSVVIMDEAHKLLKAARQMFWTTLEAGNIQSLIETLRGERFILASESLADLSAPLLDKMRQPFEEDMRFAYFARLLALPVRNLLAIQDQLKGLLSPEGRRQLNAVASTALMRYKEHTSMVCYVEQDDHGGTKLCATTSDLAAKLRSTLWINPSPLFLRREPWL